MRKRRQPSPRVRGVYLVAREQIGVVGQQALEKALGVIGGLLHGFELGTFVE